MGYRVWISESADRDLDEILSYIAGKLANPKAAADFADALEEKYGELESHPFMFEESHSERLRQMGYRRFVVGNYIILYLVDETQKEVMIARIFYGRQDYEKYI